MCVDCLVTARPERGRTCLDAGAYAVNFKRCTVCGQRSAVVARNRREEEDEDDGGDFEQTVTFDHLCGHCHHNIASHYYTFAVTHLAHVPDGSSSSAATGSLPSTRVQQEYLMECALCGRAADSSHAVNDVLLTPHPVAPISHAQSTSAAASVRLFAAHITVQAKAAAFTPLNDVEDAEWED